MQLLSPASAVTGPAYGGGGGFKIVATLLTVVLLCAAVSCCWLLRLLRLLIEFANIPLACQVKR